MNRTLIVTAKTEPLVRLRSAGPMDQEDLRTWKNAHKEGFFFRDEITPEMQKKWFQGYLSREHDYMFVVEHEGRRIGCMAFRLESGGHVDAYNIIAAPQGAGKGLMKAAMALMCSYAADKFGKDIGCLVLKNNPAVEYYKRCGFAVTGDGGDHHVFTLDWTRFQPAPYVVAEA